MSIALSKWILLSTCVAAKALAAESNHETEPRYFGEEAPTCRLHAIERAEDYPNRRPISERDQLLLERKKKADEAIATWETQERARLAELPRNSAGLMQLPLDKDSPLALPPRSPAREQAGLGSNLDKKYQFGNPELVFQLRRAAKYAELMSDEVAPIYIGDLSAESGETPDQRHRVGAHANGLHADIYYPAKVKGQSTRRASEVDMETTGWMIYSLMRSPSTALVLTAYKDELSSLARHWFEAGLIEWEALVRFEENLTQDMSENHTEHLHVNATGLVAAPSELKVDDLYKCFSLIKLCQSNMTRTSASWSIIKMRKPSSSCPLPQPTQKGLINPASLPRTPATDGIGNVQSDSPIQQINKRIEIPGEIQVPVPAPALKALQPAYEIPEMLKKPGKPHGISGFWNFWKTRFLDQKKKVNPQRSRDISMQRAGKK